MDCEILLLGPITLRCAGHDDPLGTPKQQRLLAALAMEAGKPVTVDALIARMWDDDPPDKPRTSLHSYFARLRRRLEGAEGPDGPSIVQHAGAYTLRMPTDRVDCHRFQRLGAQARSLADSGDDAQALALLRQAEALWRGEPLSSLTGDWVESVRRHLFERRLAVVVTRIGLELRAGQFAECLAELTSLVERHPTHEGVVRYLMVAAYGCGRQADALHAYEVVRRRLGSELGASPAPALTRTYELILNQVPVSELLGSRGPAPVAPNNLPSHGDLVGRQAEMRLLQQVDDRGAVALQTLSGMGGVGKSLLAFHAARALSTKYPDGQICIDLRGHSAERRPTSPQAALSTLLRLLGVPAASLPSDLTGLTALWRTALSSRRIVVILDDVADAAQVRPLLPGTARSLVIMTSRRRLVGLPGVRSLFLDVLSEEEATELFTRTVGPERTANRREIADLVRLCGYLPLAIELVAGRLVSRTSWTPAHLIRRLSQPTGRLDEIRNADGAISAIFDLSYETLTPPQQRVFRLISCRLAPHFGPHSAAALAALPVSEVEHIIETLLDAHLLQEPAADRFTPHDLLDEYALRRTTREESADERERAVERLVDFLLCAAARADRLLFPRRHRLPLPLPTPTVPPPSFQDGPEARQWLNAERTALIAAERHARTHGAPGQAAAFSHVLADWLEDEGEWWAAEEMHRHAAQHWRETADRSAEARALIDLCTVYGHAGQYHRAQECGERALVLARAAGETVFEEETLTALGTLAWHMGELATAVDLHRQALEIRERANDPWKSARSRLNIGISLLYLGDYRAAETVFSSALSVFRSTRDFRGQSICLNNIGNLFERMGDTGRARENLDTALDMAKVSGNKSDQAKIQVTLASTMNGEPENIDRSLDLYRDGLFTFRQLGDRRSEAQTLTQIGVALQAADSPYEAAAHYSSALELARGIGAAHEECQGLRLLGEVEHQLGDRAGAVPHLTASIALARRISAAQEEALARDALATLYARGGEPERAVELWRRALTLFTGLAAESEARRVRGRLSALEQRDARRPSRPGPRRDVAD